MMRSFFGDMLNTIYVIVTSNMSDTSIIVHNLVKQYAQSKTAAVQHVDLEVKKGEIFGFLGPNGAGKSTTIKILVTTLFPTSGTVIVNGHDVTKEPKKVRRSIGVVYQNTSLDLNLTAEENLRSHAVLYGLTPFSLTYKGTSKEYKDKVQALMELITMQDNLFDIVKTFSGGMRRKLDIAKALLHTPDILFLDEPTTGLDPTSRRAIWEYLGKLQKERQFTIFLTTQYLEEAEICNRISIIDKGTILVTDTPANLKKTVGDELLYITPHSRTKLSQELTEKHIEFKQDDDGQFIINLGKQKAQKVLATITTDLDEINIKKPSLDDVFISYTGRQIT